jgi:Domain of unknown function (DUF5666)
MKGYGYGTPSGVEESGARQTTDPRRAPSKAPQQEEGASVTQPHARAEVGTLTGRIVSTGQDRLTIQAPDGLRNVQLTGQTQVRGGGRTSTSQLRAGDEVRVSFDPQRGTSVAKRIEVRATGSSGKANLTPSPGSATPPGSTTTPSGIPRGPTPGTAAQGGTTAPGGDTRR